MAVTYKGAQKNCKNITWRDFWRKKRRSGMMNLWL